ncbi:MAG TPA: glutamate--tRNA ligase [bacterium]|nr:glutamate--tRNA ligase [bacterium]
MRVRVRFAPSPTGYLHVGGARTALFNWLFARHTGGTFILRIEDTDRKRSADRYEKAIIDDLRYLRLDWDEGLDIGGKYGPYRQSERFPLYKEYAKRLLKERKAYYCYCTEEELGKRRKEALGRGQRPGYDGRCRRLTEKEIKKHEKEGRRPTIRFKVPKRRVVVSDLVRGEVTFKARALGDFIILRSDGVAAFNFANIIDDMSMGITHVIRGEDHLSNTPRQILLYQALGIEPPKFAHISMILGPDRARLSKRHGATSITEYRKKGYLPEALVNYLALLGWYPPDGEEINSIEELVKEFSLGDVSKSPAVFDNQKLNWMDGHYIRSSSLEKISDLAIPYLKETGYLKGRITQTKKKWLLKVIEATRTHLEYLAQVPKETEVFFTKEIKISKEGKEILKQESSKRVLSTLKNKLKKIKEITDKNFKPLMKGIEKETGYKGKDLYLPIRFVLTGKNRGPELHFILPILGKKECLRRLSSLEGLRLTVYRKR